MSKDIQIKYRLVKLPEEIIVDDIKYPNNQHNWDIVAEYNDTGDESVLDKLVNFSLVF